MAGEFQVSQSKVNVWLRCRYAYYQRYVLGLTKRIKSRPLQFGSIVHEMLEADAENKCPFALLRKTKRKQKKLFSAERAMYGEIIEDIRVIVDGYFEYWAEQPLSFIKHEGKRAEHWIEVTVADGLVLVMKLDGFVRTPNKLRWLAEHKTGKAVQNEDANWRNTQTAVYLKACEMIGIEHLDGVLWNFILSKPPTIPQLLKSGKLSEKNIVTLPAVVEATCEKHHLDIDDYPKLVEHAENSMDGYYKRTYTPLQPQVVDTIFADFVSTALELRDGHGKLKQRHINNMHCSWCDYEPICRAELTGGDSDLVRESEYDCKKPTTKKR